MAHTHLDQAQVTGKTADGRDLVKLVGEHRRRIVERIPADLVKGLSDGEILRRLDEYEQLLNKAESAASSLDAAPFYAEATKALTAPAKPKPPPLRVTDAERAEYERLIAKADAAGDRYLARGYRDRADDIVRGKIL